MNFKHLHIFYLEVTFYICTFAVQKNINHIMNITNNLTRPVGSQREIGISFPLGFVFLQSYGRVFNIQQNAGKQNRTGASIETGI